MAATLISQIRAYNDAALQMMPPWARFAVVVAPDRCCGLCAQASGAFSLDGVVPLPHRGCTCSNGCVCFYAVRLEPLRDPHDADR